MTANAKNGFLLSNGHWQNHYLNNPVSIVVVNLMPTKETTERQFLESFNSCLLYTSINAAPASRQPAATPLTISAIF